MSKILVVDDHPITREPLARLLRFEGFEAACAANGAEALDMLEKTEPDLVLLDLMMPKVDGLAFLRAARAGRWKALPVIVMTGVMDGNQIENARALGVRDLILKARFGFDDLLGRIRKHIPDA